MNDKHTPTPGPWEASQYGNSFIVTAKGGMYDVAVVRNIGNEDNEANARLIAASPIMYEYIASRARDGDAVAQAILEGIRA